MKTVLVALNAHYMHTNLAVRYLKASLSSAGFDAEIYENHINTPYRKLLNQIAARKPGVVGFSCYIYNIALIKRLCGALKKALPQLKIILGGPEVSYESETLVADGLADYIVSGEGERAVAELLAALEAGEVRAIPGVTGLSCGALAIIPPNPPLEPAEWPDAYGDGIDDIRDRILYVETSRGCPYRCSYCLSSARTGVRALSAEASIERLTGIADQGAKLIKLVDRTFNFDVSRANAIFDGLIRHAERTGLRPVYHFEIGAHLVGDTTLDVLKRAPKGLFQFEIGIQSTDEAVLQNIGRTPPFERIAEAVRKIVALQNIHVHVDLIAGLPGENMKTFARSLNEAAALGAGVIQLGFLKVLKGSALRRDAEALGVVYEPEAPYEVLFTRTMSFDELCHLKDVETAVDWYLNSGRYPCPIDYLLTTVDFFMLFSKLASSMREAGVFDAERGEKARADALLQHGSVFDARRILGDLVRHDLIMAGRRRDLPDALVFTETEEQRSLLRGLFHPVRGQSAFDYPFDIEAYLRDGQIIGGCFRIVYDAGKRFFRA